MRIFLIVLSVISAILAVVLSVLPISNMAFIPAITALVFGLIAFYLSNKVNKPKHTIKLAFLLTILALSLATYKSIFSVSEVGNVKELEITEQESEQDAIEELEDINFDEIDLREE